MGDFDCCVNGEHDDEHDGFDHCAGCQATYQASTSEEA